MSTRRRLALAVASAGMIALSLVAAPVVADPGGWGPEESIAPAQSPPYDNHATVVRTWPNGAAVAAWVAMDGRAPGPVTVARRDSQGRWSAPVALSNAVRAGSTHPVLALGAHGVAAVVWGERTADGGWEIKESHLVAGSWTVASALAESGPHASRPHPPNPQVTVDGRGTSTVVWSRGGVHGARRIAGRDRWIHEEVAGSGGSLLRLASNRDGDLVAAWRPRGATVVAATRRAGVGWSPAHLVTRDEAIDVQAAIDGQGRALVVWSVTGLWDDARHDYVNYAASSRSTSSGRWSPPVEVTDRLGEDGSTDSLVMRPSGAAVLVWYQIYRSDSSFQVWTARFHPDGTWSTPARVGWCAQAVRAWLDPGGVAHAITSCQRGVWESTQVAGQRWGPRRKIGDGLELDADGRGRHLTVVYVRQRQLFATALTVTR